jgi:hypothetical protein
MRLLALLLALAPVPLVARADERVDFLSAQLERSKDPRVRAQLCLALGATGEASAVPPLCAALSDECSLVRRAAAKALGMVHTRAARDCLAAHEKDPDEGVAADVARELSTFEVQAVRPVLYVSLAPLLDRLTPPDPDLLKLAEAELRAKLEAMGAVWAPPGESLAEAKRVLKEKKLTGVTLVLTVQHTSAGALKLTALCMSYPEKRLLGELSSKAKGASDAELIKVLVPKVLEDAAKEFQWSAP